MGIVVCIILLLGVIMFLPQPWKVNTPTNKLAVYIHQVTPGALIAIGSWNWLWHGLRHLDYFWGLAALISGLTMMLAGLLLGTQNAPQSQALMLSINKALRILRLPLFTILLASFLLYLVTLVRLNLGLSIIS